MLVWALKYWKIIALALAVLSLLGTIYYKAYNSGKDKCEDAHAAQEAKSTNDAINIRNRQNEIRNNRPDNAALIDSLRDGSF